MDYEYDFPKRNSAQCDIALATDFAATARTLLSHEKTLSLALNSSKFMINQFILMLVSNKLVNLQFTDTLMHPKFLNCHWPSRRSFPTTVCCGEDGDNFICSGIFSQGYRSFRTGVTP